MKKPSEFLLRYLQQGRYESHMKLKNDEIEEFFSLSNNLYTKSLLGFVQKFDGFQYEYYDTGLLEFNLIRGGGYPFNPKSAYIDIGYYEDLSGKDTTIYFITKEYDSCLVAIDEDNVVYEDNEISSSSIQLKLEDLALYSHAKKKYGLPEEFFDEIDEINAHIVVENQLQLLPEFSDQYISWYKFEKGLLRKSTYKISLFK